jgi:hypothetical protein
MHQAADQGAACRAKEGARAEAALRSTEGDPGASKILYFGAAVFSSRQKGAALGSGWGVHSMPPRSIPATAESRGEGTETGAHSGTQPATGACASNPDRARRSGSRRLDAGGIHEPFGSRNPSGAATTRP